MNFPIRPVLFLLLLSGGIAAVVYGAHYHTAVVGEEREVEREILIPLAGFAPGAGFGVLGDPTLGPPEGPATPDVSEGMSPDEAQGFMKKKVTQRVLVDKIVAEPRLNREVSIGGVALSGDGTLLQTYISGRPPSLCPT
jgi:hypothetical protein